MASGSGARIGNFNSRRIVSDMSHVPGGGGGNIGQRNEYWNTVMNTPSPSIAYAGGTGGSGSAVGPVRCPECCQMFKSRGELHTHKVSKHRRSSASRPFRCDLGCTQDFTQRSHLNQHVRTVHERLKPFSCKECERSFGKRFDLSSHEAAVHRNQRPYVCRYCDKAFAKRSNMVRHEGKLHSSQIVSIGKKSRH